LGKVTSPLVVDCITEDNVEMLLMLFTVSSPL